jgi:hypothetical protein
VVDLIKTVEQLDWIKSLLRIGFWFGIGPWPGFRGRIGAFVEKMLKRKTSMSKP